MEIWKKLIGQLELILCWRTQCGGNREEIVRATGSRVVLENTMRWKLIGWLEHALSWIGKKSIGRLEHVLSWIGKKSIGRLEHVLSWRTQCDGNREEIDRTAGARLVLDREEIDRVAGTRLVVANTMQWKLGRNR